MSSSNLIKPVILCGGSGTRLWPLSRGTFPKQFLKLGDDYSLFQKTLLRLSEAEIYAAPLILTNENYRFLVAEQALEIGIKPGGILLEPVVRNTAAAIGAATAYIAAQDPKSLIYVLPSDHLIDRDDVYDAAVQTAAKTAAQGHLVTFGITPNHPATGYGYIKAAKALDSGALQVATFIEKPALERANAMLSEGGYSWNSGMFLFMAETFLNELEAFEPDVAKAAKASVANAISDLDFVRLAVNDFEKSPDISVDYAVFERTKKAAVVPAAIKWSDIGSFKSLMETQAADENGNVAKGPGTFVEATGNMVISQGPQVVLNGVSGLTVVATHDAILVSDMEQSEKVKDVVAILKQDPQTRILTHEHKTIYRPWGGYTSVLNGERFQVKKLFVLPGKKLSLQKHHHRAEHWVVVNGTAEVTIDDTIAVLSENQSIYIPLGAVHRLANPGKIMLEVIEVQSGSYLGEDDIIRIEDEYGRGRTYQG